MSDFTFLHSADIHLDSPLRGLERYEGAPVDEIRNATRSAFTKLVDLALKESVDFVIIAGDIYDGDWRDYNTGLFFIREMGRLRENEIPAYIIAGNHDAASVITRQLQLPANVHRFSSAKPETLHIEELGVALHGQSFATRAVTEDLSENYPQAVDGFFNIGILHTCATGRPDHNNYAPCTIAGLSSKGYDYWALGHIHKREILSENPWIVFPGNPQGRHIREQGAKGCTLVTVSNREIISMEAHELDVLRWTEIDIDCSNVDDFNDLHRTVTDALRPEVEAADGRTLAARLKLSGRCPIHSELTQNRERTIAESQAAALNHFFEGVWIEKILLNTRPAVDLDEEAYDDTPASDLLQLIDQISADDDEVVALGDLLSDLRRKIPADAIDRDPDREFSPSWIRARLNEIREELPARLLQKPE